MTGLQGFLDACKKHNLKVEPEKDYTNYGSTSYLEIEFPDHTKFYLHPITDYDDLHIEVDQLTK